MAAVAERNQDATVYVGGLDEKVTEHLLAELFIQGISKSTKSRPWVNKTHSPGLWEFSPLNQSADLIYMSTK